MDKLKEFKNTKPNACMLCDGKMNCENCGIFQEWLKENTQLHDKAHKEVPDDNQIMHG